MKHAKHLLALLLSFILIFAFATLAFAEEEAEPVPSASVTEEEELAPPASAAEEEVSEPPTLTATEEPVQSASTVDWDEFYIITQPENSQKVSSLKTVELRVEVNIPAGVVVEYQWYGTPYYSGSYSLIPGATNAVLRVKPGDSHHPMKLESVDTI